MKRNSNLPIFRIIGDLDVIEDEIIERTTVRKACKSEIELFLNNQIDGAVDDGEMYLIAARDEMSAIKQCFRDCAYKRWASEQVYKESNHDWSF